jgi:colanic acid/amylovoran biosynthesis glycosyltransferase
MHAQGFYSTQTMRLGVVVRVAYLVNKYPAASHSFIRREIKAVEAEGTTVFRFSVRPVDPSQLPDPRDQKELSQTLVILRFGIARHLAAVLKISFCRPEKAARGLRIAFLNSSWRFMDGVRRAAYFAEAALLADKLEALKIDHLHAHFGTNPATVARITSILSGIPYSFTVHGPDEFDAPLQFDLAGKIADCAFCAAISSYGRSQLMRWSAYEHWPKIKVIRCGVENSFLQQRNDFAPPVAPRLCTVARLSAQKGIPLLLTAVAQLMRQREDFHLTIVGDGEMRGELEQLIKAYGLSDKVTLAGLASSDDVIAHLLAARAMVLPSFAEGLPVAIMEALALERPVITTSIAGIPELIDAKCGWLVPAGSVEQLASAMQEALRAPVERLSEMGRIGRLRVADQHNAGINGRHLNDMFNMACTTHD